jgi:hypothetical protein
MVLTKIIIGIITVATSYLVSTFLLSRLFIPNLGFKRKIKEKLPHEAKEKLMRITKESKDKNEALKKVISYQLSIFYSEMRQVYPRFKFLFESSFNKLWEKKGFLHCHQQNFVLRRLLLGTGMFTEKDIKLKHTFCYLNMHQYLKINIGKNRKEWLNVDPFAMSLGYDLGEILPNFAYPSMKKRGINPLRDPIKSKKILERTTMFSLFLKNK